MIGLPHSEFAFDTYLCRTKYRLNKRKRITLFVAHCFPTVQLATIVLKAIITRLGHYLCKDGPTVACSAMSSVSG